VIELFTILCSSAATAALIAGALWLCRNLILERLKQAVAFEYATKLENFRAELAATQQHSLEAIRAANSQQQAIQATATASLTAAHLAGNERRLKAIESIWTAVVSVKQNTPPYMTIADLITPENYDCTFGESPSGAGDLVCLS
jgi:hypothetical protein